MKKHFLLILCLLTNIIVIGQNWVPWNPDNISPVKSIYFKNDSIGYITKTNGKLMKTTNGGVNWVEQNINTTNSINEIKFANDSIGFIVGTNGLIMKTTDNGNNWNVLNSNSTASLSRLTVFDKNNVIIYGSDTSILKTVNGGSEWMSVSITNINSVQNIYFTNNNVWYALVNREKIIKTANGGYNWVDIASYNSSYPIYNLFFVDSLYGFYGGGGYSTYVKKTIDGGVTWSNVCISSSPNSYEQIYSIYFADKSNGIAVGGISNVMTTFASSYITKDGGNTWVRKQLDGISPFNNSYFIDTLSYYAFNSADIYKYQTGIGINEIFNNKNISFITYPNPAKESITLDLSALKKENNNDLIIYNAQGLIVYQTKVNNLKQEVDISYFNQGIYIIKVTNNENILISKFIKE